MLFLQNLNILGVGRENLSVDTSFDAFIYNEHVIFSSLVSTHFEMERKNEQDNFFLVDQVSTVVFTLRDGLFDSDYFKCNYFLVEIYLSRVSLMNLYRILIIYKLCFCNRVLCTMLETSCLTNFRCIGLQFRGVDPIWLIRESPCKGLQC